MRKIAGTLTLILSLLLTSVLPAYAADELPAPFCGELAEEDCAILQSAGETMLELTSYASTVEYKLVQSGIPELPPTSEMILTVDSQYAFTPEAHEAMRTLAIIAREDPLGAVKAVGDSPALLLELYNGITADLIFTLDLSESWTRILQEESDVEWPEETTVEARLVDGVLYFDIHELKPMIPELTEHEDWVAFELSKALEAVVEDGSLSELANGVADSTEGRDVWGFDPLMLNLLTSMRSTFGRPQLLWPYMEIERRRDADLGTQDGAVFVTEFNTLDFILSNDFRELMRQVVKAVAQEDGGEYDADELNQMVSFFWLFAPVIFRDLEISGTSTIGLDDSYLYAGDSLFHWDLTELLTTLNGLGDLGVELSDEIFIDFRTSFENREFDEPITVEAPADAEIVPLEEEEAANL